MVGGVSTAHAVFFLLSHMTLAEQVEFSKIVYQQSFQGLYPTLIREALRFVKEHPSMSEEEANEFTAMAMRFLNEQAEFAARVAQEKVQKTVQDLSQKVQHFEPLDRTGKTFKAGRNEIIHRCLTEKAFAKADVYPYMMANHRDLMMKGKKSKRVAIADISMWKEYEKWLRSRRS